MGCSENPWNTVPLRISFVSWSCSNRDWKMARRGASTLLWGPETLHTCNVSLVIVVRQCWQHTSDLWQFMSNISEREVEVRHTFTHLRTYIHMYIRMQGTYFLAGFSVKLGSQPRLLQPFVQCIRKCQYSLLWKVYLPPHLLTVLSDICWSQTFCINLYMHIRT